MISSKSAIACVVLALALGLADCAKYTYMPGVNEVTYPKGGKVSISVNSLRSLSTLLPYEYYHFPFCTPDKITIGARSLGEVLWGDKMSTSLYDVPMAVNESCKILNPKFCNPAANTAAIRGKASEVERLIMEGYRAGMSIDNLPVYLSNRAPGCQLCNALPPIEQCYPNMRGVALGVHRNCYGKTALNNHIHFIIDYHEPQTAPGEFSVVGFQQIPFSIKYPTARACQNQGFYPDDPRLEKLYIDDIKAGNATVYWTYSVAWRRNDNVRWATRWDAYLSTSLADTNDSEHYVRIGLSLAITFFIMLIVSAVLARVLHKEIQRYNTMSAEELQEEVGWKLVHADVFRSPPRGHLFAGVIGNGVQLLAMTFVTLGFCLLGVLSPAKRGTLLATLIILFVIASFLAGYTCGHFLKLFNVREWKYVFLCGGMLPAISFFVFFFVDLINWHADASDAVPFSYFLLMFVAWGILSVGLTVLGGATSFSQPTIEHVTKVGRLAREIPVQRWYHSAPFVYIVPPLIPLAIVRQEWLFIMSALWLNRVYYVFGFLTILLLIWSVVCMLVAILVVYYQLCYENYRWWWTSVMCTGCMGAHMFLLSTWSYLFAFDIHGLGTIIYFAYMGLFSLAYGIASGALGFLGCWFFTRRIYSSLRLD